MKNLHDISPDEDFGERERVLDDPNRDEIWLIKMKNFDFC